jgi:hypothetical protein
MAAHANQAVGILPEIWAMGKSQLISDGEMR